MKSILLSILILFVICPFVLADDSIPKDIQKSFNNLQDDNLERNCIEATRYLYERREGIVDILRDVLPELDWQSQDVVLKILTETEAYRPDEGFVKIMLERIKDNRSPMIREMHDIWHYDYILYLEDYVKELKDLLKTYIKSGNARQLWAITYLFSKKKILNEMEQCYTLEVMDFVIVSLRDDNIEDNQLYASRICLLIGEKSIPFLKKELKTGDNQSKPIAKAIINTMLRKNDDDYYIYDDWIGGVQLPFSSSYLDRIEREGANSIADFYLIKSVSNKPRFLTGESYKQRTWDNGDFE